MIIELLLIKVVECMCESPSGVRVYQECGKKLLTFGLVTQFANNKVKPCTSRQLVSCSYLSRISFLHRAVCFRNHSIYIFISFISPSRSSVAIIRKTAPAGGGDQGQGELLCHDVVVRCCRCYCCCCA